MGLRLLIEKEQILKTQQQLFVIRRKQD